MSHSPEMQLDLLFSGSREVLNGKKDFKDCIRIFYWHRQRYPLSPTILFEFVYIFRLKTYIPVYSTSLDKGLSTRKPIE